MIRFLFSGSYSVEENGRRTKTGGRETSKSCLLSPFPPPLPQDSHIPRLQMHFWCELSFQGWPPWSGASFLDYRPCVQIYVSLVCTHTYTHTDAHREHGFYSDHSRAASKLPVVSRSLGSHVKPCQNLLHEQRILCLLGRQGKCIGFSQEMRPEPYRCMKITVKLLRWI